MGTANHYFLDAVAGAAVMGAGLLLTPYVLRTADRVRARFAVAAPVATASVGAVTRGADAMVPSRAGATVTSGSGASVGSGSADASSSIVSGGCQTSAGERIPRQRESRFDPEPSRVPLPRTRGTALRHRLAELRGPEVPAKALDARALAALAANPGCKRRAILDGAGVNKAALASALGSPAVFGQSQFAFTRGNAFEAKVKADGGAELLRLVHEKLDRGAEPPAHAHVPELVASGPEGRTARTALALREATEARGEWTLLDHPMLALDVAGSPAFLEPDAVVVHPDGSWTVVEIKSFPMLDGSADPAKVGAAARQAAVYVLALEQIAGRLGAEPEARSPGPGSASDSAPAPRVRHRILLVCPKDFSNLPTASAVDVRKQRAVTARQLARLTRIEDIADTLPDGTCFSPSCPRPT